ncbi:hypothetical protein TNIN_453051 [Trichonephila inaurata madagascariensis]|uniref:Uncharacterized protein n=1 Tax=Trichonephila inaurata madagascariensis TaxID=2747483 RepID=A0A8X6Y5N6_9ARAC|nr:hypothetical protein TNIN_453051 [Trichonephila inaurata madagascariensis]
MNFPLFLSQLCHPDKTFFIVPKKPKKQTKGSNLKPSPNNRGLPNKQLAHRYEKKSLRLSAFDPATFGNEGNSSSQKQWRRPVLIYCRWQNSSSSCLLVGYVHMSETICVLSVGLWPLVSYWTICIMPQLSSRR